MKTVMKSPGLFARLGMIAAALLFGQQAFAVGTDAGLTVSNTASVVYDVGGNLQPAVASAPVTFLVDRRVDFTVTADGASDTVNPGATGLTFDMDLQNDGNSPMDFEITLTQLAPGDVVNGNDDTGVDVSNPVFTTYVDNLAEDASTTISVTGDAAAGLANLDVANIRITVTARDPGGDSGTITPLADTSGSADDPTEIDNVLADAGNDGVETGEDGFIVSSAALVISKDYEVLEDPINGISANAKAIPGAIVEYTITIDNSLGAEPATDISISDLVDPLLLFFNAANDPDPTPGPEEPYNSGASNIAFDGAGTTFCLADALDANNDGCTFDGTTLTLAGSDQTGPLVPIDVAAGASLDIRFQVIVP